VQIQHKTATTSLSNFLFDRKKERNNVSPSKRHYCQLANYITITYKTLSLKIPEIHRSFSSVSGDSRSKRPQGPILMNLSAFTLPESSGFREYKNLDPEG